MPAQGRMAHRVIHFVSLVAGLALCAGAVAATVQENALRDGCKKHYNEKTQKEKYQDCVAGKGPRSNDAPIEGCYARYRNVPDKLRQCVGR